MRKAIFETEMTAGEAKTRSLPRQEEMTFRVKVKVVSEAVLVDSGWQSNVSNIFKQPTCMYRE